MQNTHRLNLDLCYSIVFTFIIESHLRETDSTVGDNTAFGRIQQIFEMHDSEWHEIQIE